MVTDEKGENFLSWKKWMIAGWILLFAGAGCSTAMEREGGYEQENQQKTERQEKEERISKESEQLAEGFREIYEEKKDSGGKDTLEFRKQIIQAIGEQGYAAVDTDNQINMVHYGQIEDFCESAEEGEEAATVFFCVTEEGGWIRYDLETQNGDIDVTESSLRWENNSPEVYYYHEFEVVSWDYTDKGYLFLEESRPAGYDGAPGQKAFRIRPLDRSCREAYQTYIASVGYERNNLLITDWTEQDSKELDFYDLYERLYRAKYGEIVPYEAEEGAEYNVPEEEIEEVLQSYFSFDRQTIREHMNYQPESGTFLYRPRGRHDGGSPYGPYPEVTGYKELEDGKIQLTVEAVWKMEMLDCAMKSELVVRPMEDGTFQYVSNRVIFREERMTNSWYKPRLTEEEWSNYYGQ